MMTKPDFEKWVAALRSGEYLQAFGWMNDGDRYCALGVAVTIGVAKPNRRLSGLWMGTIPDWFEVELIQMNDIGGSGFLKIADWIEGIATAEGWM